MPSTMPSPTTTLLFSLALLLILHSTPVAAFGSGKIAAVSTIANKNWRHGDIEDTLLELFISSAGRAKFDNLAVKRVYFGNWLRDYSQAIDVGGLKQLPKDTIRIMLWVLSFVTFGFATGEFEVTEERLGCYRPEEHIDNPKDYADNEDARKYDSRLRGPVDEGRELAIDEQNGMKVYIASENRGIETSAGFVRARFLKAIELGRAYGRDGRDNDLYEALRQLGTGLHTLEDFSAHSNYIELALKEMGVDVFAHVGQNVRVNVNGRELQPVVTGTFGMTDFLHSMVGEVSDKLMQSEVQDLEGKLQAAAAKNKGGQTSALKKILDRIPFRLLGLGDSDFSGQAEQIQQASDAKELETKANISQGNTSTDEIRRQAQQTAKDIYPILEFHDKVMKAVTEGIDKIPGANELLENLSGAMQIYIFSVLAPYIVPILEKIKVELSAGSSGILQSSEKGQYVVFNDHDSSNPTHSMLSKDHFTNVLNEPAGLIASEVVRIVVPLITSAWDDASKDANEVCNEAIRVLHHPALRSGNSQDRMFRVVEGWWNKKSRREQDQLREVLSRDGVKEGKNHSGEDHVGGPGSASHSHGSCNHSHGGGASGYNRSSQQQQQSQISQREREGREERQREQERNSRETQQGAKVLEKVVPGLVGGLLKGAFGIDLGKKNSSSSNNDNNDNERREPVRSGPGRGIPGLAAIASGAVTPSRRDEESHSSGYGGGRQEESRSTGYGGRQEESRSSGYGNDRREEQQSSYGGRNNREEENRSSGYGGNNQSYGRNNREEENRSSGYGNNRNDDDRGSRQEESRSYGRNNRDEDNNNRSSGYGGNSGYGGRNQDREEEDRSSGYGGMGRHQEERGSGGYGRDNNERESQGRGGYGQREERSGGYGGRGW